MCEITSKGEMSAARTTMACAVEEVLVVVEDLRRDFTTSLTPRLSVLAFAAVDVGRN